MEHGEHLAAIDLGSNSFHMVVARQVHGEIQILDGLSEKVQLGAGLDGIPTGCRHPGAGTRVSGAFRPADYRDSPRQCSGGGQQHPASGAQRPGVHARAEEVLGHDIEIVAGREEARLIYLGVAHTLADDAGQRLVVDIGGGSTELIIGERFEPLTESCTWVASVLRNGSSRKGRLPRKHLIVRSRRPGRKCCRSMPTTGGSAGCRVGASGTIKAISQVCVENGWCERYHADALKKARKKVLKAESLERLFLKGARIALIFPSGPRFCMAFSNSWGWSRWRSRPSLARRLALRSAGPVWP